MINKNKQKEVILDERIIGNPFLIKELILRGCRIMPISPLCGKIEVEYFDVPENTQRKAVQNREISERGLKII